MLWMISVNFSSEDLITLVYIFVSESHQQLQNRSMTVTDVC